MTKLLITLLTSSNFTALKQAIISVENQKKTSKMHFKLVIVVNTLNDDYYMKVKQNIKKYQIIRTESNGAPGKGHNSLLRIFQKNA